MPSQAAPPYQERGDGDIWALAAKRSQRIAVLEAQTEEAVTVIGQLRGELVEANMLANPQGWDWHKSPALDAAGAFLELQRHTRLQNPGPEVG
jgi:hypothetical protein